MFDTLNSEQRAAVMAQLGPVLVKAGAGSGKTRVLTYRIAYLIEQGASSDSIVSVTFTNKAASELRTRLRDLLGKRSRGLTAGTFHAICGKLLRQHITGRIRNYTANFTIYAGDEQLQLVQQAMDSYTGRMPHDLEAPQVLNLISRFKSRMQPPTLARQMANDPLSQYAAAIYRTYQRQLERSNAVDFDDMIVMTYKLLFEHHDVLDEVQSRWAHVLVDEYQDTDSAQYALLELLSRPVGKRPRSLFAVGDAQQSIYGFRNADYTIINRFTRDFPEAQVVELLTNYRSRQEILDAAYAVMRHSVAVPALTLKAARRSPPVPALVINEAADDRAEADAIAKSIGSLLSTGRRSKDIAILYRSRHMSRGLETALRQARIPYSLKGQAGFYDRRVIRDALAFLRIIANPSDSLSMNRIINVPARGIGASTIAHLTSKAAALGLPLGEAILKREAWAGLSDRASQAVSDWARKIYRWRKLASGTYPPEGLLQTVLQESGYQAMIEKDWKDPDRSDALAHLEELRVAAGEHTNLAAFLQEIALLTNVEDKDERDAVQLLTIHGAKGLEWPIVYVAGLEEGTLPHERSLVEAGGVEEERRLCYVALTRAGEQLYLSHAKKRQRNTRNPSRFLDDILVYGRERAKAKAF
ncbi:ATP-dependent helicase [Herpetosiphon llansteffanensis]|uniref:ATP-dependent helicase n=1 Tax=Herpetosiphon llansteffanensis TaxID=2094568 RepID=UPI000D7B9CC5|nr:UvrD-helicase domain-containing protein [Herpetosiphon llansteffanensis]